MSDRGLDLLRYANAHLCAKTVNDLAAFVASGVTAELIDGVRLQMEADGTEVACVRCRSERDCNYALSFIAHFEKKFPLQFPDGMLSRLWTVCNICVLVFKRDGLPCSV